MSARTSPPNMVVMDTRPVEIDVVELLKPAGEWPAGTTGTVVSTSDDRHATVEISRDRDGAALDFVEVPYADLRVIKHAREFA